MSYVYFWYFWPMAHKTLELRAIQPLPLGPNPHIS
jgi:hypothetical protein